MVGFFAAHHPLKFIHFGKVYFLKLSANKKKDPSTGPSSNSNRLIPAKTPFISTLPKQHSLSFKLPLGC